MRITKDLSLKEQNLKSRAALAALRRKRVASRHVVDVSCLLGCDAVSLCPEASRPWKMTAARSIETLRNNLRTERDGP